MGRKAKHALSPPLVQLQPPLKPLRIALLSDKPLHISESSHESDSLLARNRLSVRPFPPSYDLEHGDGRSDSQWQVLCALNGVVCTTTHHVLELVQLKRTNFGVRWRETNGDTDVPPRCVMGPHWHLMLATFSVFFLVASSINILTVKKAGGIEVGAGGILSALCLMCYALVGCSDPGIVSRIEVPPDDTYTYCDYCASYRPEGYVTDTVSPSETHVCFCCGY